MEKYKKTGITLLSVGIGLIVLLTVMLLIGRKKRKERKKICEDAGGTWDRRQNKCIPATVVVETTTTTPTTTPTTNPTSNDGGSSASNYSPKSDVLKLTEQIVGGNAYCRTNGVNRIIMPLTDAELRKLNSAWRYVYKMSLWKYLDAEWDQGVPDWSNCYPEPMARLKKLGLK